MVNDDEKDEYVNEMKRILGKFQKLKSLHLDPSWPFWTHGVHGTINFSREN